VRKLTAPTTIKDATSPIAQDTEIITPVRIPGTAFAHKIPLIYFILSDIL
jgi:hypothetical protein